LRSGRGSTTRRLQVDQLLLQILDGRDVAAEHVDIRRARGNQLLGPLQIGLVARESGQELIARNADLVHADVAERALERTHLLDLLAQGVAQPLDHLGGEADGHQLVLDLGLRLQVGLGLVALLLVGGLHLVEPLGDVVELLESLGLELFELGGVGAGRIGFFFGVFVEFGVGHRGHDGGLRRGAEIDFLGVGIDQAVDHFIDAHGAAPIFSALRQHFVDGGRAGGDGLHHVLQAIFDALGDLDLALAGEQLDRAHLAHVHAHRVGGATEFGVDRGQRGLGLFFGVFVGRGHRGGVRNQQGLGIRGLVVDRDAHVVERADDRFDRLGVDHVIGQVVVDLDVGQEAAFLAQLDQLLELVARGLAVGLGQALLAAEFLQQRLFLGTGATLGLGRGHDDLGHLGLGFGLDVSRRLRVRSRRRSRPGSSTMSSTSASIGGDASLAAPRAGFLAAAPALAAARGHRGRPPATPWVEQLAFAGAGRLGRSQRVGVGRHGLWP
jgi:hypothetical protein